MSFPGLERCEHGEYVGRECLRCEVDRLRADNKRLREIIDRLMAAAETLSETGRWDDMLLSVGAAEIARADHADNRP